MSSPRKTNFHVDIPAGVGLVAILGIHEYAAFFLAYSSEYSTMPLFPLSGPRFGCTLWRRIETGLWAVRRKVYSFVLRAMGW